MESMGLIYSTSVKQQSTQDNAAVLRPLCSLLRGKMDDLTYLPGPLVSRAAMPIAQNCML